MQSQAPGEVTSAWCMMLEPLLSAEHFPSLLLLLFLFFYPILTPGRYLLLFLNCLPSLLSCILPPIFSLSSLSFSPFKMVGMPSPQGWCKRWAKHFSTFGLSRSDSLRTTLDSRLFSFFFHNTTFVIFPPCLRFSRHFEKTFFFSFDCRLTGFHFCVRTLPSST